MPTSKAGRIIVIFALMVLAAGAAYLNRDKLAPYLPFLKAGEEKALKVLGRGKPEMREIYTCTMHPQIIREKPGECPICGMTLVKKLVPAEVEKQAKAKPVPMPGMEMPAAPPAGEMAAPAAPAELKRVSLDPRQRMLANVETTKVVKKEISQDVATVGKIAIDEQSIRAVSARYAGRVERMEVNFMGQFVKKGRRSMSIYSPELMATEKEYLI